jgi:hypothetical protein
LSWAILFDATNCAQNYFAAAKIDLVNIEYVLRAHGFQQLTEEPGDRKFVRRIRLIGSPHRLWPRVPAVYLTWVNPVFLAFFAFNGTSNLRAFNVAFSSIPTAPTNPSSFEYAKSAVRGHICEGGSGTGVVTKSRCEAVGFENLGLTGGGIDSRMFGL